MKLGSLFDGSGTCPLAAVLCGIEPIWASEIEKFPIEVTKKRFPYMKHLGDITKINGAEIEPVDIITFGSPCQDLSVAGKRAGLKGERSNLFMEAIRIIREMKGVTKNEKPRFIMWENVPGAFSSNKGYDFRTVLEEIAESDIPMPASGKWANAGMVELSDRQIAWRTLDAQYWNVPQRRKRIFLVADFRGKCAGEILFKRESVCGDITQSDEARKGITGNFENGIDEAGRNVRINGFEAYQHHGYKESNKTNTLTAGQNNSIRGDTPLICVATDQANAENKPYVCSPDLILLNDQGGLSINVEKGKVSPTLRSEAHGNLPIITIPINTQIALRHNVLGERTGLGIGKDGDPAFTLQEAHSHGVAILEKEIILFEPRSHDGVLRVHKNIVPTLNTAQGGQRQPCISYGLDNGQADQIKLNAEDKKNITMRDTAGTLRAGAGAPKHESDWESLILSPVYGIGDGQADNTKLEDKVIGTLTCMHDQQKVLIVDSECKNAIAFGESDLHNYKQDRISTLKSCGGCMGGGSETLIAGIDCRNGRENGDLCGTLQAKDGGFSYNCTHPVRIGYTVRRLTPTECAKLQGFPAWWCADITIMILSPDTSQLRRPAWNGADLRRYARNKRYFGRYDSFYNQKIGLRNAHTEYTEQAQSVQVRRGQEQYGKRK